MRSRTAAAAIFGLLFGFIFASISLVTPTYVDRSCPSPNVSERQYLLLGIPVFSFTTGDASKCDKVDIVKNIGFPVATKTQSPVGQVPYGVTDVQYGPMEFHLIGFVLNIFVFFAFGFIFFFIFSPTRRKQVVMTGHRY